MSLLGIFWLILFLKFKDLRKAMVFSGFLYMFLIVISFFITKILSYSFNLTWKYVPDYWNPTTFLNLGEITGGVAIEDLLFMLFFGGIVTVCYEIFFKKRILKSKKNQHRLAIIIFFVSYVVVALINSFNVIYNLIIPSFTTFLIIIIQRKDLIKHAVYSGLIFLFLYFIGFFIFNLLFPNALENYWNLSSLSGISVINVPIEELMYAASFGLMWGPMYEYVKGKKVM